MSADGSAYWSAPRSILFLATGDDAFAGKNEKDTPLRCTVALAARAVGDGEAGGKPAMRGWNDAREILADEMRGGRLAVHAREDGTGAVAAIPSELLSNIEWNKWKDRLWLEGDGRRWSDARFLQSAIVDLEARLRPIPAPDPDAALLDALAGLSDNGLGDGAPASDDVERKGVQFPRGPVPRWDWDSIKAHFLALLAEKGVPGRQKPIGWQLKSDAERALVEFCSTEYNDEPTHSTLDAKITEWLKEHRQSGFAD